MPNPMIAKSSMAFRKPGLLKSTCQRRSQGHSKKDLYFIAEGANQDKPVKYPVSFINLKNQRENIAATRCKAAGSLSSPK